MVFVKSIEFKSSQEISTWLKTKELLQEVHKHDNTLPDKLSAIFNNQICHKKLCPSEVYERFFDIENEVIQLFDSARNINPEISFSWLVDFPGYSDNLYVNYVKRTKSQIELVRRMNKALEREICIEPLISKVTFAERNEILEYVKRVTLASHSQIQVADKIASIVAQHFAGKTKALTHAKSDLNPCLRDVMIACREGNISMEKTLAILSSISFTLFVEPFKVPLINMKFSRL